MKTDIVRTGFLFIISTLLVSCSEYQKVLKSTDFNYKHDMAIKYYEDEEYYKALPILEEMVPIYKGSPQGEKLFYYYAYCNYHLEDFTMAGYYFESFGKVYPYSQWAEECSFLAAKCYYLQSPEFNLDQSNTLKAISQLQLFVNRYPNSAYETECNRNIDELRKKLEFKEFYIALLYYRIESYKAAIIAFETMQKDFPGSPFREQSAFLGLKSQYLLAMHSIPEKKIERFDRAVNKYNSFSVSFPQSTFSKEAKAIYDNSVKQINAINKSTPNPS